MAIRVTNNLSRRYFVPGFGGNALAGGERRVFQFIEYDFCINDPEIKAAMDNGNITVENLDNLDIKFESGWNEEPQLELGNYHIWVDANGDTRINVGTPTADDDGDLLGSSQKLQQVQSDMSTSSGWSFAALRGSFFTNRQSWYNRNLGTWDSIYQYCFWSFWWPGASDWTIPQKFDTQEEFFTWLEANVPSSGTNYTEPFKFSLYEVVDTADIFPKQLRYRNSLVASILGRQHWTSRWAPERYGVSFNFDAPSYYLNFYGELARRCVQADLSVLPPTNNNGAIWHTNRKRTIWSFPKVGSIVDINAAPGLRGAIWDNGLGNWVSPAPQSSYIVDNPMMLAEYRRNRILSLDPNAAPVWRQRALNSVCALVFPVYRSGNPNQRAYIIYPHGVDTFTTEYFNLTQYELILKVEYRGTFTPVYHALSTPQQNNDGEHLMWSIFPLGGGRSLLLNRLYGGSQYAANPDNNAVPERVLVARRNKVTGARSPWFNLLNIRKRIPHATFRVEPARPRV